jgi:hypothetical protein
MTGLTLSSYYLPYICPFAHSLHSFVTIEYFYDSALPNLVPY